MMRNDSGRSNVGYILFVLVFSFFLWAVLHDSEADVVKSAQRYEEPPTATKPQVTMSKENRGLVDLSTVLGFVKCLGMTKSSAEKAWESTHHDVNKAITFLHIVHSGELDKGLGPEERNCLAVSKGR